MQFWFRSSLVTVVFLFFFSFGAFPSFAADIFANDTIILTEKQNKLKDLYLFGETILVNTPIKNDLVAAGGDLTINKAISGSVLGAGGNIVVNGTIGNTIRIVGGDLTINEHVTNDVIVIGGTATITKNAFVEGDVVFVGGELIVEGPIKGKLIARGGDVRLNSTIGGNVETAFGKLKLGPKAHIAGDLFYASSEKANKDKKAVVEGTTRFHYLAKEQQISKELISIGSLYKLTADIAVSLILILLCTPFITNVFRRITDSPFTNGGIGLAYVIVAPVAILFSFILIWLGILSVLFYVASLVTALFLTKILFGWGLLSFFTKRDKKTYLLDWKAGIIGPITVAILLFIPIVGWIAIIFAFLITIGAMIHTIVTMMKQQNHSKGRKQQ